ncbi:MAG: hypothetical protein IJJ82_08540 [Clostridia bacterium]|nr:hypothetical protein [Clostridia bacterium]
MVKSIFDIENRLDIQHEFKKMVKVLHGDRIGNYSDSNSYMGMIERFIFTRWEYRDTIIDVEEYLMHIGITKDILKTGNIENETFLYYLQFILNMEYMKSKLDMKGLTKDNERVILSNIPLILEKMNYTYYNFEDKVLISKRNADTDSVINKIPMSLSQRVLEYNDFRIQDNIEEKKKILKDIDLYIEKIKNSISSIDGKLVDSIGTIVNKMGVNHPIDLEFKSLSEKELIKWYDKCYLMMLHAIRSLEIQKIKKERENLVSSNK